MSIITQLNSTRLYRSSYINQLLLIFSISSFSILSGNPLAENLDSIELRNISQEIESEFSFVEGSFILKEGIVKLQTPTTYSFLDSIQTFNMIVNYWGESPNSAKHLGILAKKEIPVFSSNAIVFTIDYIHEGHISLDNQSLLKEKYFIEHYIKSIDSSNSTRRTNNLEEIHLTGWALEPFLDQEKHALYWIEDIRIGKEASQRLCATICILGRNGYIRLSSITDSSVLTMLQNDIQQLVNSIQFYSNTTYNSYSPSHDKASIKSLESLILGYNFPQQELQYFFSKYWKLAIFSVLFFGILFLGVFLRK